MSSSRLSNQARSQDQSSEGYERNVLSTNQQVIGYVFRGKLPESPAGKRRRRKESAEPAPARVPSEAELREEAAWKQVEETGKPVLFDGNLLIPDGMHVQQALEYLPDGLREQAQEGFDRQMVDVLKILLDGAKNRLRQDAIERGDLERYEALHPIGKMALAEWLVRKQMHMPEVPLEEIIDRLQKQDESDPKLRKQPKPAKIPKRPHVETDKLPKPQPAVNPEANLGIKSAPPSIFEHQESLKISQVSQWNLEHHGLLLKRLDQIWKYLTDGERQAVLGHLGKDIGKAEIDEIDEIIKGCEWVRRIEANTNNL